MSGADGDGRRLAVVIAGGGTGGHLYPGIAVAREILAREPGAVVTFAGTARGIEFRVLPREGFELELEIGSRAALPLYLVEERTGLPAFPGLDLETQPGTMLSPGEFAQGVPGDFTAIYRDFELAAVGE